VQRLPGLQVRVQAPGTMKAKRIGIDGATWDNRRGYGRFTREIVRALLELERPYTYSLFLNRDTARDDLPAGLSVIEVPTSIRSSLAASADSYRSLGDMWAFTTAIAKAPVDLIFFPSVYSYVPVLPHHVPLIVGFHDSIAEMFPYHIFNSARARLFWTLKTQLAVRQAARILTVSEHAKRGVQSHFSISPEKIRVTHEAAASIFRHVSEPGAIAAALERSGIALGTRYIIYFGGLTPHKNVGMLVETFAALSADARFAGVKLILAGDYERDVYLSAYPALRAQVDDCCRDAVIFTGHVDDDTAACLLGGALASVLPSLEEGFGLPGIEAAACGAPLIATRNSAMPEWLGDAALYIDPNQPSELRSALERVLLDEPLRRRMSATGMERARQLTWRSAAERVAAVFDEW
jgi:glycosyltransferase involved in cell wall biosynthesis